MKLGSANTAVFTICQPVIAKGRLQSTSSIQVYNRLQIEIKLLIPIVGNDSFPSSDITCISVSLVVYLGLSPLSLIFSNWHGHPLLFQAVCFFSTSSLNYSGPSCFQTGSSLPNLICQASVLFALYLIKTNIVCSFVKTQRCNLHKTIRCCVNTQTKPSLVISKQAV